MIVPQTEFPSISPRCRGSNPHKVNNDMGYQWSLGGLLVSAWGCFFSGLLQFSLYAQKKLVIKQLNLPLQIRL